MDYYDEYYPVGNIPYSTYERDIELKNREIEELQNELGQAKADLEEALEIIKELKGEIKKYEKTNRKNSISVQQD